MEISNVIVSYYTSKSGISKINSVRATLCLGLDHDSGQRDLGRVKPGQVVLGLNTYSAL
jgi:hypothetical protein